jgi:hypothetical protein
MIEFSKIETITVESYVETLRLIEVGGIRYFRLIGTAYSGFHNAKTRLVKKGFAFDFNTAQEGAEHYIEVKRIK